MALQGNLRDFSATEILQLLATQRKTGCLVIEHRSRKASVFVTEGRIVSTRGGDSIVEDRLWRFLKRVRRLSDAQFIGVESVHAESRRDLEKLLLEGHYLENDELSSIVERQILDDLSELIEWNEGTYRFDPDRRWSLPILARLSIEASLIEAARRADERHLILQLFQDGRQIVSVKDLPDPDEEIADEESELFGIIDGQHTIREVIASAPLTDYEASEALHRMVEAGWVEFTGRREGPAPPPGEPTAAAQMPAIRERFRQRSHDTDLLALPRELAMAIVVLVLVAAVAWIGHSIHSTHRPAVRLTAFEDAGLRDIRYALELYRSERGRYPANLEELTTGRWIDPRELVLAGRAVQYEPLGADDFRLEIPPPPTRR
jgi:hypothetical protein